MEAKYYHELNRREKIARSSKMLRLLYNPVRYLHGMMVKKLWHPVFKKAVYVKTRLLSGDEIIVPLPEGFDLYLLGCKSDDAEIRLTRFLLKQLNPGSVFLDVGAHIGYYSLLAAACTGMRGRVISVEASPSVFLLLKKNIRDKINVQSFNIAFTDQEESVDFFEFPLPYSEYNTLFPEQYSNAGWFKKVRPVSGKVQAVRGDTFLLDKNISPDFIKADVEGAEEKVIAGLSEFLQQKAVTVIMEFVCGKRGNTSHIAADRLLKQYGFTAHSINREGETEIITKETGLYVEQTGLESDNLVYTKKN